MEEKKKRTDVIVVKDFSDQPTELNPFRNCLFNGRARCSYHRQGRRTDNGGD